MSRNKPSMSKPIRSSRSVIDDDECSKEKDNKFDRIMKQMKTQMKKQLDALGKISESQEFLSNQFDELQAEIKIIRKDNKKMKADIEQLKRDKTDLGKRVQQLEQCMTKSKQDNNSNSMVITNVPKLSADIDLKHVVLKIGEQVEQPINNDTILNVYQVLNAKRDTYPIVVKLKNDALKRKCMEFRKLGKKIQFEKIVPNVHIEGKNINFHQLMEKEYTILLNNAKKAATEKGYKYVWFANGAVLVRKTDDGPITKIRNNNDLENLE